MTPLEQSHVVCEEVKENMALMGSSGPFILPITTGEFILWAPLGHESLFNPKTMCHWKEKVWSQNLETRLH